jgi:hypothetical protein
MCCFGPVPKPGWKRPLIVRTRIFECLGAPRMETSEEEYAYDELQIYLDSLPERMMYHGEWQAQLDLIKDSELIKAAGNRYNTQTGVYY